jgi:hypothetical protein
MSTAVRSWSARTFTLATIASCLGPSLLSSQVTDSIAQANQRQARALLAETVQALGGQAWLHLRTSRCRVRLASFFQGTPTGDVADAILTSQLPDKQRVDLDKGRVVQIFSGSSGWEITYKGKKNLSAEKVEEHRRWQKHSLHTVLDQWYGDPSTALIDEGASQVERRPAEKIMLIHPGKDGSANDAATLEIDAGTHLPLRLSFSWRDPQFHDKNVDAVEYDNYHRIDGVATPLTVTETHNGEIVHQTYGLQVEYNIDLPGNLFDPGYAAAHLK